MITKHKRRHNKKAFCSNGAYEFRLLLSFVLLILVHTVRWIHRKYWSKPCVHNVIFPFALWQLKFFLFFMRSPMLFNDSNEYWFKSTLWCLVKIRQPMHFYHTHTYAAAAAKRHRHFFSSFFLIVRLNFSSYFSFVFFHSLFERYSDPFVRSSKCYYANDETQRIQIGQWLIEYDMKNICM